MSTPRFIADLHLGHKNIYKYRPIFESTKHNDLFFIEVLQKYSTKRDIMYFCGDILFNKEYFNVIRELPGKKFLVLGNHDTEFNSTRELTTVFDEVYSMLKYHEFWLTHAPLHADELRMKRNIHGHVHTASIDDVNYLNVSVDSSFMKFVPRTLFEVREAFKQMKETGEIYKGMSDEEAKLAMAETEVKEIYQRTLLESRKTIY